jgi:FkbM family methyltransferase
MASSPLGQLAQFRPKPRKELPRQPIFSVRPGTSDEKAIKEVFDHNAYRRKAFQIERGERWLDMGCNVGAFSVLAGLLGCTVRSIEAEGTNAQLAARNIGQNGLRPDVIHAAIVPDSHQGETVGLNVNTEPLSLRRHSILRARRKSAVVQVPARRFSSFLGQSFDCIKLNIEGAEIPILREHEDWSPVRKLVLEWSFDAEPRMAILRQTLDRLEASFPQVMLSKGNLPWHLETYPYFPPNVYIFCMR